MFKTCSIRKINKTKFFLFSMISNPSRYFNFFSY